MTIFNESQPQSRRAARRSEREESAEQAESTGEQPEGEQLYSPSGDDSPTWNESPDAGDSSDAASAIPRGRRAAAPAGPPSAVSEPLSYRTQQQSSVPTYDGPSFTNQTQPSSADDSASERAVPADDSGYRQRDYSPEGQRSAPISTSSWAPVDSQAAEDKIDAIPPGEAQAESGEHNDEESAAVSDDAPTDAPAEVTPRAQFYVPESALHDTIVPGIAATAPFVEETAPEGEHAPVVAASPEHTMTRRELRALEAERAKTAPSVPLLPEFAPDGSLTDATAAVFVETSFNDDVTPESTPVDDVPIADLPAADVPDLVDPIQQAYSTSSPFAPTRFSGQQATAVGSADEILADDAAVVDEVEVVQPALTPFDALFQVPPAEPGIAPVDFTTPADSQYPPVVAEPIPLVDPLLFSTPPVQAEGPALTGALAEFESLTRGDGDVGVVDSVDVTSNPASLPPESQWTPPLGHWSAQDDVDEDAPGEGNISRTVSSGISTTSALVLPAIPDGADIRGPLTGTGEIRLTGSIDLPRTLSATGQSDRFDGDDVDALFDLNDAEVISTDSSPVRAIRAVSTHTSGHGVTHTKKPKGNRALTGLLIAASSLAVVVAGLLVAAFAFNLF